MRARATSLLLGVPILGALAGLDCTPFAAASNAPDAGAPATPHVDATPGDGAAPPATIQVLATNELGARGLAASGEDVYWIRGTSPTDAVVRRRHGDAPAVDVSEPLLRPTGVVIGAGFAYWLEDSGGNCVPGIYRHNPADTSDAGAAIVTTCNDAHWNPGSLAVDALNVYFTNAARDAVYAAPAAGGNVFTVAGPGNGKPQVDPTGIAANARAVYWTSPSRGEILAWSKADTTVAAIVTEQAQPRFIAATDAGIVWTTLTSIVSLPTDASTPTVLAEAQSGPVALAVDDGAVFWGTSDGAIRSVSRSGGVISTLATEQRITSIARAPAGLYWTTTSGEIVFLPLR